MSSQSVAPPRPAAPAATPKARPRATVRQRLEAWLDRSLRRAMLHYSSRSEAGGVELRGGTLEPWMVPLFFAKVERALALIEEVEPRRMARIRRDVAVIAGERGGYSYWYEPLRLVVLCWPHVLQSRIAQVAMTIVHEATHARINRAGLAYVDDMRGRIEAACVRQEMEFALRLPHGDELAERQVKKLDMPWWTGDEHHRLLAIRARAHGVPEWWIAWAERRRRRAEESRSR